MRFLSLFSGIGGFDLAFTRAGMVSMGMCEIDKHCQDVLFKHFEFVHIFDDVREINGSTYEKGSIDVICGGFPCQDVSIAGKRAGLAGERSGLWWEFARIIDELEPRWVIAENVPGLLSSDKGADFANIIQWLAQRGYGVAWRVLDAQYFGVAQRRRRVFIVGSLGNGSATEVLFEHEGVCGDPPQGRKAGEEVAYSIRASPSHGGDKGDGGINTTHEQPIVFDANRDGGSLGNICPPLNHCGDGKSAHGAYSKMAIWEMQHASEAYRESGNIASTLQQRMGTGGNQVPLVGIRRLTPTECERLQGFPDGWTNGQSDSTRYRQLGNAVAVPVVEWIARRIPQ